MMELAVVILVACSVTALMARVSEWMLDRAERKGRESFQKGQK